MALEAHVSPKAAQVAQESSKLSLRGAQIAQNWTPRDTQNPQNLTFEHQGMGTKVRRSHASRDVGQCFQRPLKKHQKMIDFWSKFGFPLGSSNGVILALFFNLFWYGFLVIFAAHLGPHVDPILAPKTEKTAHGTDIKPSF